MELCSVLATADATKLAPAPETAMEEGEGDAAVVVVEEGEPGGDTPGGGGERRESRGGEVVVVEDEEVEENNVDLTLAKDQEMATEEQGMTTSSSQAEQGRDTDMTH